MVPVARDKNFYARDNTIRAIEQHLCPDKISEVEANKPANFPRTYAIYGPGGMGKTQIAAHFVTEHQSTFDAVFWVRGEDSSKIAQDYKDIAVDLGLVPKDSVDATDLEYTKDILKRWLVNPVKNRIGDDTAKSELASWLLVFDGVEDGSVLNEVWPYNGPGSILVTSRNPHSWSASWELRPFNVHDAAEFLLRHTERDPPDEEKAAAAAVANRLGGLPLALSQMAGIIVHRNLSFKEFLHLYDKQQGPQEFLDLRLMNPRPSLSNYEYNVASVWAFDRLDAGGALINVLSMLDPDGISEKIFAAPILDSDSPFISQLKANYVSARNELLARSLISGNKKEKRLFIHKLVQDVARSKMRQVETRNNFLACFQLICGVWPFEQLTWRHGIARWEACEELVPHVQRLKTMYLSLTPSTDSFDEYDFARLLIDAGWYTHERGNSPDAILFNNMAQHICESLKLRLLENPDLGRKGNVTLARLNYSLVEITHNRGCIALEINEPSDAIKYHTLFNETMVKESSRSEHEDMRLAISWNELGNAHMLNGDWSKGEECFLTSIEEMRKFKDFRPTTISLPLANLGLSYWLQGKTDVAYHTLMQGLRDREQEYGPDDRVSFITGRFFHAIGNVKDSVDYHRRALMHYKSTLGNRHHRTADLFVKMAEHHIRLNKNGMALALLDHAFEAYSSSNTFVPEKARAWWMRHKALKAQGKLDEAGVELDKCFQVYRRWVEERQREGTWGGVLKRAEDLEDRDIDPLIVFWSK
ncbi:TPR-like protein [Lophiostoma macrostomum CBS 122681]|uniref:TPR-like protein n=1 Tax=Lophiostoma macrostomum CBS 122681 TaxID=1314788 RepID=A0A6A6TAM4_9PLEO|nr:TPR-like protein [Lophiostoma macrostomum CBS 122681]